MHNPPLHCNENEGAEKDGTTTSRDLPLFWRQPREADTHNNQLGNTVNGYSGILGGEVV